jgi:hypothetical protein
MFSLTLHMTAAKTWHMQVISISFGHQMADMQGKVTDCDRWPNKTEFEMNVQKEKILSEDFVMSRYQIRKALLRRHRCEGAEGCRYWCGSHTRCHNIDNHDNSVATQYCNELIQHSYTQPQWALVWNWRRKNEGSRHHRALRAKTREQGVFWQGVYHG